MSPEHQLYKAIFDGDCQKIESLLKNRDVGAGSDNLLKAALLDVIEPPKPEVVQLLIRLGVDVNAKDRCGWTPLHFAARSKVDPSLSTACVKLLIDAGADVNAEDIEGLTPMHRSICEHPWNLDLLQTFLAAGAKPSKIFLELIHVVAHPDKMAVLALLTKYGY